MDCDVMVVGGGPVGLMLACELGLAGVAVTLVERGTEIDPTVKAGAVNTPTVEALHRRGLLPGLQEIHQRHVAGLLAFRQQQAAGPPDRSAPRKPAPRFAGHFAGIPLDGALLDEADPAFLDRSPVASAGLVPQQDLERLLAARARELGVVVRRGEEVVGFTADADGVTVSLRAGSAVRAGWLVGCDGGRSLVRRTAGFAFPGTDGEITGRQAVAEMTGTEGLRQGWNTTPTGVYAFGPTPGRILTVEFEGPPADRSAPVTAAELEAGIRHVTGAGVRVHGVSSVTRFTDNARQADSYRRGRVLLAGDAAHVHSPFGGQGLNLGVGDAVNLGWKLAAVVRGTAPEGLLDSYTAERRPLGAWVLEWSRAQVALMRPEAKARAAREVVRELAGTVTGTTHLVKAVSGVEQHYDLGGDHRLVGRSAPELPLADGTSVADHLHEGRAVLFVLADGPARSAALREAAAAWSDRVRLVDRRTSGRPGPAAMLVRPDGYVAWAVDAVPAPGDFAVEEGWDVAGLRAASARWFGVPAAVVG